MTDDGTDPVPNRSVAALEAENASLRERVEAAERRNKVLLSSLQHRVRNAIALVRSIARRTALTSETIEDFQARLDARLGAVARAQALALLDTSETLSMEQLLAGELLAYAAHEGEQISLRGPVVRLGYAVAGPLGLAIHELAVNAVEYGALSQQNGRIKVSWQVEAQGGNSSVLRLDWREAGVPAAAAGPRRRGFGTEMIEQTLAYELDATASLGFGPDGIHCTIALPCTDNVAVDSVAPPGLPGQEV